MDKSIDDKENLDRFNDDEEGGKKYQLLSRFQTKIILMKFFFILKLLFSISRFSCMILDGVL